MAKDRARAHAEGASASHDKLSAPAPKITWEEVGDTPALLILDFGGLDPELVRLWKEFVEKLINFKPWPENLRYHQPQGQGAIRFLNDKHGGMPNPLKNINKVKAVRPVRGKLVDQLLSHNNFIRRAEPTHRWDEDRLPAMYEPHKPQNVPKEVTIDTILDLSDLLK